MGNPVAGDMNQGQFPVPKKAPSRRSKPKVEKYRVDIVQKTAASKAQAESLRIELERQGYRVTLHEYFANEKSQEEYLAQLIGERQVPVWAPGPDAKRLAPPRKIVADRRFGFWVKTFWWVLVIVAALVYLSITFSLWTAIKAVFDLKK